MEKSVCWTCDARLVFCNGNWHCPLCKDKYIKCIECEHNGTESWEQEEVADGAYCARCGHYHCNSCWQNKGNLCHYLGSPDDEYVPFKYHEDDYLCESCFEIEQKRYNDTKKE